MSQGRWPAVGAVDLSKVCPTAVRVSYERITGTGAAERPTAVLILELEKRYADRFASNQYATIEKCDVCFGWSDVAESPDACPYCNDRETAGADADEGYDSEDQDEDQLGESGDDEYRATDTGNARRFARDHARDVRFVITWGRWITYQGASWETDLCNVRMQALAAETTRNMYAEASAIPFEGLRKQRVEWALRSEAKGKRSAMVDLAKSEPGVAMTHEALDANDWILPVANGTIDLKTGELRPHRREDFSTRLSPVAFERDATCPRWDAFLHRIMGGDGELVAFLQRAVGYSLTGSVQEQVLFFAHGEGANGKSTFVKVLLDLLGPFASQGAPTLLLEKKSESHPTDQAMIFGSRVVACQEIDKSRAWAEATVKQLTGGDRVTARRMGEDFWSYRPTFKFWIAANNRPKVRNNDHAMWRRVKLIPFAVTIPEHERDRDLDAKLRAELPGILAWAVRGCLAWQRAGLSPPAAVEMATQAYRESEDVVARFLADRCVIDSSATTQSSVLFKAFRAWCEEVGETAESQKEFSGRLEKNKDLRGRRTKSGKTWDGVRLLASHGSFDAPASAFPGAFVRR